jgi:hypothetical protein
LLIQLYFVFPGSGFDALPGGGAFSVGHTFHLIETGDCIAHVSSVMDGFFTFLREREVFVGDMIAASFSDFGQADRIGNPGASLLRAITEPLLIACADAGRSSGGRPPFPSPLHSP